MNDNPDSHRKSEVQAANAAITPFAAAIAIELQEIGFTHEKIEEVLLRSAARLGAMHDQPLSVPGGNVAGRDEQGPGYFEWMKNVGGQTYDFLTSLAGKHGPVLLEKIMPAVTDALARAVADYFNSKDAPKNSKKSK